MLRKGESRHTSAGLPTPAAGMIPPSGFPVSCTHSAVPLTAAAMLSVSVTSTAKNLARDGPPSCLTSSAPASSLRSRMEMFPPSLFSSTAVARPRPDALFLLAVCVSELLSVERGEMGEGGREGVGSVLACDRGTERVVSPPSRTLGMQS